MQDALTDHYEDQMRSIQEAAAGGSGQVRSSHSGGQVAEGDVGTDGSQGIPGVGGQSGARGTLDDTGSHVGAWVAGVAGVELNRRNCNCYLPVCSLDCCSWALSVQQHTFNAGLVINLASSSSPS